MGNLMSESSVPSQEVVSSRTEMNQNNVNKVIDNKEPSDNSALGDNPMKIEDRQAVEEPEMKEIKEEPLQRAFVRFAN